MDLYIKDKDYVVSILGDDFSEEVDPMTCGIIMNYEDIRLELDTDNVVYSINLNKEEQNN